MILPSPAGPSEPRRHHGAGYHWLLAMGMLLMLGACATPQMSGLLQDKSGHLPRRAQIGDIPFHAQEDYQCGPAALAMALGAAGARVTPVELAPMVYVPGLKGSLQAELKAGARRRGFVAATVAPKLDHLLTEVATGHPVIVLQNLGLDWIPVWHYAVVIGYDLDTRSISLRSGRARHEILALSTFERTWARAEYWAMLALPPAILPATLASPDYLRAVMALESVDAAAARKAYQSALVRWPDNLIAMIGLANTAYGMGDLGAAERTLKAATQAHPESAAAYNNFAQLLHELGRRDEAFAAAQQALRLGGTQFTPAMNTLSEVQREP